MSSTEGGAEAKTVDHRVAYASGAVFLLVIVGIVSAIMLPVIRVVPGLAVVNQQQAASYAADVKAVDEAAAAQKAANDAAQFLALTETNVKQSMQKYVDDPANGIDSFAITVYAVTLISVGNNKYEGMAEMSAGGRAHHQILVHVIADKDNTQWETDKGGLLPLIQ